MMRDYTGRLAKVALATIALGWGTVIWALSGSRAPTQRIASSRPVAVATRVPHPPEMNGTLDGRLWAEAKPVSDFRQIEPYQGRAPSERTEVRILFTREAVFFGVMCYDTDPQAIEATQLRRDQPQDLDDNFEILIDSSDDHRDAYVFQFNALGAQSQGTITNEKGGSMGDYQLGWDGVWSVRSQITNLGWSATVKIPFRELNLMRTKNLVWGLNFKRFIRRKNETDLWAAYQREFGFTKVSRAGSLRGIADIGGGRLLIVKPYGLAGADRQSPGGVRNLSTAGGDVKYGLRSNLIANLTFNTDFGEAEVDQERLNLTPYKLFYPETRDFFLENASTFSFPLGLGDQLFYSRQIGVDANSGAVAPVDGGAKITGVAGPYEVGLLDVQTRRRNSVAATNYGVFRLKRSLLGNGSYIGVLGTAKQSNNPLDRFNRAAGVDGRLEPLKNLVLTGYAARTQSPGLSSGDSYVGGQVGYTNDWLQFEAMRDKIGANYNPEVGFVNRTNVNESFADLTLAPRPRIPGVRELNFEGFVDSAPDTTGVFQSQEWQGTFRLLWNNGAYTDDDLWDVFTQRITTPFAIYRNISIPAGLYHFARHQITYGSPQDRDFTYSFFERFGGYYGGSLNEARVRAAYRPTPHWSGASSLLWDRFQLPAGRFSVILSSVELDYSPTRLFSASLLGQVDTANPHALSVNARLRWNYRPNSDIYFIFNHGTTFASIAAGNPIPVREDRVELKITRSFFTPSWGSEKMAHMAAHSSAAASGPRH